MNMQQNTKHTVHTTQIDRQVDKKTNPHDIDSWRQANREGMCEGETENIISKVPRLVCVAFFLPFFRGFRRPNLINGPSKWRASNWPLRTQEPVPDRRTGALPI